MTAIARTKPLGNECWHRFYSALRLFGELRKVRLEVKMQLATALNGLHYLANQMHYLNYLLLLGSIH
jgi:hypothetical protein